MEGHDGYTFEVRRVRAARVGGTDSHRRLRLPLEYLDFAKSETHGQQLALFMKQTHGPNGKAFCSFSVRAPKTHQ
jgi:hypothetical protein